MPGTDNRAAAGPVIAPPSRGVQSTASIGHVMRRRSVIAEAGWFQAGTPAQRRRFVDATREGARTAARNRSLVLAHPDLAEQLVRRLGYYSPEQWNGYIPTRFFESGGHFGEKWVPNDSPVRDVLVALVAEAESRGST